MKLIVNFPKTAIVLCSILVVSVSGGRKTNHHHGKTSAAVASAPVATPIVESDATSSSMSQSPVTMAQSRSSPLTANERSASSSYSQPIYSSPYDPALMADSSIPEASSYYDSVAPTSHNYNQQYQQAASASGHYHHHVPAPAMSPHARHAGGGAGAAAATAAASVAPYGGVPYGGGHHQGYYGGYGGYDYPAAPAGRYVAQGSHHHHHQDAYVAKRAHGYGGYGWHPDLEVQTLFFIGIPLIIIPLLFLWPYFLYSLHGRQGWGGGGFGYRAAAEDAEIVPTPQKELKAKTDELTKKVLPKLSKKSDKSSKSSDKSSSKS